MAQVVAKTNVSNCESWQELMRYTSIALTELRTQVNGNLNFSDNMFFRVVDVTFATASGETIVQHTLGRAPIIWLAGNISTDATVWQNAEPTSTQLNLSASLACSAKILLI